MIFLLLATLAWTSDLDRAIQIQLQYAKDPAQRVVLEHLRMNKGLKNLAEIPLGKLRVTGYYTPLVYTREQAEKQAKMQGSVLYKRRKGSLRLMAYRGKKAGKDAYSLLGDLPRGASGMPLVARYSVAVDPKRIPYGSVLLTHIHGEPRLLFAQDTGAKVQRNNELDIYMGIGEKARREAMKLYAHHEVSLLSLAFQD